MLKMAQDRGELSQYVSFLKSEVGFKKLVGNLSANYRLFMSYTPRKSAEIELLLTKLYKELKSSSLEKRAKAVLVLENTSVRNLFYQKFKGQKIRPILYLKRQLYRQILSSPKRHPYIVYKLLELGESQRDFVYWVKI